MNPKRRILLAAGLACFLLAALIFVGYRQKGSPAARFVPRPAPDFSLPGISGETRSLADYHGKVVLLDFWATWCDPCRDEIPHFIRLQNQYGNQGLQILGVSMDDNPEPVRDFYQKFAMNYPVVMGNAKVGELYGGILGLPIAFLVDRDGQIRKRHIGATNPSVFEKEIAALLREPPHRP